MPLSRLIATTQRVVREVHARFFDRGLPDRIALLGHALPARHHRAFREMAAFFTQQGYEFTTPDGVQQRDGRKRVLVSFDDCYRDWFEALELFDSLAIKATFYVSTLPLRDLADTASLSGYRARIGVRRFEPLSSEEVVALRARGHIVGSHSHSHFDLASLPPDQARAEIRTGKAMLERILGEPVEHFAYPYGMRRHFTRALHVACMAYGFRTVASGIPCRLHRPSADVLHRTQWNFGASLEHNLQNLRIDGSLFERFTGRSVVR